MSFVAKVIVVTGAEAVAALPKETMRAKEVHLMMFEVSLAERDLLKKILDSYLSELRQAIAATKRDTSPLHAEENLIKELQIKVSQVK